MNNKIFLLVLITLLVIGCKYQNSDPLFGLTLGSNETTWNKQIEKLIGESRLSKTRTDNIYSGYLLDSIPVSIQPNTYIRKGKLINYEINFTSFPLSYQMISRAFNNMVKLRIN